MRLGLEPKLTQSLKIAPQLIQSLKMLQMPVLKLEQMLRHELQVNPLLEEIETQDQDQEQVQLDEREAELVGESNGSKDEDEKIDWEEYLRDNEDFNAREFKPAREQRDDMPDFNIGGEISLYEHLLEQLSYLKLSPQDYLIGEFIIGNIDDSGYLSCTIEELAEAIDVDPDRAERVLFKIQKFDPAGVGARDLQESLLIQLRERKIDNNLAYRIVEECLDQLAKKSYHQIAKSLGVSLERIQEAMEVIRTLSPSPAYGRFTSPAAAVIPDLIVEKIDGEWVITHNDRNVPQLRVNSQYREVLRRGNNAPKDTKAYVREKLDQAKWLLKAIDQRRNTMVRVMHAIVEEQIDFFEKGPENLRPLRQADIAEKVEMNIATISRVSKEKYVQTPHGVFEIKHFFTSGVSTGDGEQVAKRQVKQEIEKIISDEDPAKPYSDQQIYRFLSERDYQIARRTVTKYREELNIPAARFRRRAATGSE